MKEFCEFLFCFWRKCCRFNNKKMNQIEYTKMFPKISEKKKNNTEFFSTPSNEKNTLKFKERDTSTTKLTIIEEETIFPLKYLNSLESIQILNLNLPKKIL